MTVTVSMSAVWLKLVSILCLSCTALSGPEGKGVVWKKVGEAITIQCRPSQGNPEYLSLKKGLSEEVDVIYMVKEQDKDQTIVTGSKGRIQQNGAFPNVDLLIRNLTSEDTGPYWCVYKTFDVVSSKLKAEKGSGSVLLVVTDERGASEDCETPHKNLVLVSVVISAAVLLGFIIGIFIWLFKTKTLRVSGKPRPAATNDVYEDMRSTLRR